ncbi:MAG: UDP-N-acetylmuramoyl-tripeptide--D-alanyl-D-alanine ligase [Nevskiales bacterium]|nr:UDP-N-acetylmuramoyl-tripeptide--D-alanyl-D-alanine ligase [Nevskiales bacterium]
MMALTELARVLSAERRGDDPRCTRVEIDSRRVEPGDLFVALRGDRFDGHGFVAKAKAAGAVAALVERWVDVDLPQVRVGDTLLGLQQMAADWRRRFQIPVIAVTGSNGKTTTKQLIAAVAATRGPVLATQGNLNNHIGVPLTLLSLRAQHRTAVVEMGANHLGEIALLARLAAPDVGVVTQAGDAHLDGFGSRDGVARGKGELFAALDGGVAVINADDRYAPQWREMARRASVLSFGLSSSADVRAVDPQPLADASGTRFVLETPTGHAPVQLPLPGNHNVMNALAAAACGVALGLDVDDIARGLEQVRAPRGRVTWLRTAEGARVLDDSYNANPTSLRAGLELLAGLDGRRWLVLGDMAELGPESDELHAQAGVAARSLGIDRVFALGPMAAHAAAAFGRGGAHFESVDALVAALRNEMDEKTVVLIKGSRASAMDRVVAALVDAPADAGPAASSGEAH